MRWLPPHVDRLLDVGCASGYFTIHLARRAGVTWAVDVNPTDLLTARQAYAGPALRFQAASATALPFPPTTFDAVTMLDVLEHVPDDRTALAEVCRVLRPGGVFILSVPHQGLLTVADPDNLEHRFPALYSRLTGAPADPTAPAHRHYTLDQLRDLLAQAGFRVERAHRSSLLLYPLALWVDAAAVRLWGHNHPLGTPLSWLRDLSYAVPCGPLAYNLMIRAVKTDE